MGKVSYSFSPQQLRGITFACQYPIYFYGDKYTYKKIYTHTYIYIFIYINIHTLHATHLYAQSHFTYIQTHTQFAPDYLCHPTALNIMENMWKKYFQIKGNKIMVNMYGKGWRWTEIFWYRKKIWETVTY